MKKTLVFVANSTQWERILHRGRLPESCVVASFDLDLTWKLRSQGIQVIDLFGYLDGRAMERAISEAWGLCQVVRDACSVVTWRGEILSALGQNDLMHVFLSLLSSFQVVQSAIEKEKPERVICFNEMERVLSWDAPGTPPDGFNSTVAWLAQKQGLEIDSMALGMASATDNEQVMHLVDPEEVFPEHMPSSVSVLCRCAPGFAREQQLLWDAAAADSRSGWVLVTEAQAPVELPVISEKAIASLPFDLADLDEPLRLLQAGGPPMSVRDYLASIDTKLVHHPFLITIWDEHCRHLRNCAQFYEVGRFLAKALQPQVVVTDDDFHGAVRAFQRAFMQEGVPTIAVHHAGSCQVDGVTVVSGGVVGEENAIVVNSIRRPTMILGKADGRGGIRPLTSDDNANRRTVIEWMGRQSEESSA